MTSARLRHRTIGLGALLVALVAALVVGAGVGVAGLAKHEAGTTLNYAFSFDPGTLDPDIFYGNEALVVTTSCYDGLLRYKDNTTQIEPWLATSWSISKDSKTYTFHLRPNVTFADGTKFTSEAMKYSFQRRGGINAGPGYMVAPIASMDTPDPLTLVVHLSTPIDPFLHWLASPYGTKAVSPTLVKAHATKKDPWAKGWLATHCAGSGPYTLSSVVPAQRYVLSANPKYWGPKPYFTTVNIDMIPSFSTQELKLKSGDLDLMTHGIPSADVTSFSKNSKLQVVRLPAITAINLWLNPHKPNLANVNVRKAVGMALNRAQLVQQVYGQNATLYSGIFAPGSLPPKWGGVYSIGYNPAGAKAIVSKVPSSQRSLNFVYTTDDAANQQLAGLIAAQLNAVGFKVTIRGIPETEVFNYPVYPESKRPDMVVVPNNPDDASPPSNPQLMWVSVKTAGTYFQPLDPSVDKILFKAKITANHTQALKLYGEAANKYGAMNVLIPLANAKTVIVSRAGITGFGVQRQGLWTVDLATLRAG